MNLHFEECAQPRRACHNRRFRNVDFPNDSIYVRYNNNGLIARYRRFNHTFGVIFTVSVSLKNENRFLTALPSDRGAITKSAKLLDNTNAKNKMIQGQIMTFTSTLARGRFFLGRHNAIETNRGNFYIKISVCSCRNAYNDRIVTVVD